MATEIATTNRFAIQQLEERIAPAAFSFMLGPFEISGDITCNENNHLQVEATLEGTLNLPFIGPVEVVREFDFTGTTALPPILCAILNGDLGDGDPNDGGGFSFAP